RADDPDLGGAGGRRHTRRRARRARRSRGTVDPEGHGRTRMSLRWHLFAFWLAALGMLCAVALPLARPATASLAARPALFVATIAAAALYALAGWLTPRTSIMASLIG